MLIKEIFSDLVDVIYPKLCLACNEPLNKHENIMCLRCQVELPITDYAEYSDNPVAKKFWGRVPVEHAMALYHFHKESRIQHLLHQLKYKGRKDVGIRLGNLLGYQLIKNTLFNSVDYITSVPLHKEKEVKRGYNQSDLICEGLSDILNKPFENKVIYRKKFTESQTKKSRMDRWENVKEIFEIPDINKAAGKHILLIDDVITTGSTLEACVSEFTKIDGVKVSIAAVAHAEM